MLFNPLSLMEGSGVTIDTSNTISGYELRQTKHSFFVETLQFLSEANNDFYDAKRLFYKSLVEASEYHSTEVIHESFGDFFDAIKRVIDRFLAFIKSLFDRFLTLINKMIGRDKYILNREKELEKFTDIHNFTITGYEFTFSPNIPVINTALSFDSNFIFNLGDTNSPSHPVSFNTNTTASEIKAKTDELNVNLTNGDWYNKKRAEVLGLSNDVIYSDDYADKLFATFRNEESVSEEIDVDSSYVRKAFLRFKNSKKDIDEAKKLKARIDTEYTKIRKSTEAMVKVNRTNSSSVSAKLDDSLGVSGSFTGDQISALDNYAKAKVNQIQEMANIHALAFAAKLDALKDCYNQDKMVLFKALSRVQSNKED